MVFLVCLLILFLIIITASIYFQLQQINDNLLDFERSLRRLISRSVDINVRFKHKGGNK